jgi:hypothetical protein
MDINDHSTLYTAYIPRDWSIWSADVALYPAFER